MQRKEMEKKQKREPPIVHRTVYQQNWSSCRCAPLAKIAPLLLQLISAAAVSSIIAHYQQQQSNNTTIQQLQLPPYRSVREER